MGGRGSGTGIGGYGENPVFASFGVNDYQIPERFKENDALLQYFVLGEQEKPKSLGDSTMYSNPNYSRDYIEFQFNCQRCVMAYELRRRGYDVEALPTYDGDEMGYVGNYIQAFKGATLEDVGGRNGKISINNIENKMREWGDGARAIIRMRWNGNKSGHVFNVENQGGRIVYTDSQVHRTVDIADYMSGAEPTRTGIIRVDDKEINIQQLQHMVKRRQN